MSSTLPGINLTRSSPSAPASHRLSDGKLIPALGWGAGSGKQFDGGQHTEDTAVYALKAGARHLDTAQVYNTETQVGRAIRKGAISREDVFVTSKRELQHFLSGYNIDSGVVSTSSKTLLTSEDVHRSVKETVNALGFIPDLYLVHNPFVHEANPANKDKGDITTLYTLLEECVLDGTLKGCSLGLSNFRPVDLEALMKVARIKPVVNQLEFHPYVIVHLDPVLALHKEHGILTQSYGGLAPILRHPTGGPAMPILQRIAKERNVDTHSVLYLWQLGMGVNIVTTSGNPANIDKLVSVDSMEPLSPAEVDEITQAGRKVHWRNEKSHMTRDFPPPDLPEDI